MFTKQNNIKIISGWSNTGGSTECFINLTNSFNAAGYDTTFYGPHSYHLNKCKSEYINNINIVSTDILICHFITLRNRPICKKVLLNCHEKELYNVNSIPPFWDKVIFLNEEQKNYHKYCGNYDIIPNIRRSFEIIDKTDKDKIAGIIGTIDRNKQVHISIKRAIEDSCEKIYIFGELRDIEYYNEYIIPLISSYKDKIIMMGHFLDKQKMYNMIGRVYHSSISEVASLVKDECYSTNTKFFGNSSTNNITKYLSNDEIINKWMSIFNED